MCVAKRSDGLLAARNLAATGTKVQVRDAQLVVNIGRRDAERLQLERVKFDANLAVCTAETVDAPYAGLALQRALHCIVHKPGKLFQGHIWRGDGIGLDGLPLNVDFLDNRVVNRCGER